jgi:hypothetical protein
LEATASVIEESGSPERVEFSGFVAAIVISPGSTVSSGTNVLAIAEIILGEFP